MSQQHAPDSPAERGHTHLIAPEPWGTGDPAVEAAVHVPGTTGPIPTGVSPRLYNPDLAPTTRRGRTWHAYSIFTLWANDVHSLGNYAFGIGLFALGLGAWQIGGDWFGSIYLRLDLERG